MLKHLTTLKPVKGWREFIGEVGIIVLGVMIALTADKIARAMDDRDTAAVTRGDITDEINDGLAALELRQRTEPCIDRRLGEIRAILTQWRQTGTFTTPNWIAQSPLLEVPSSRYQAEQAAGRLALLSGEEQYRMGSLVDGLGRFAKVQSEEHDAWGRLRALQMGPEALSDQDRTMLLAALQDASTLNYEARIVARKMLPLGKEFGFAPDYERIDAVASNTWSNGKYSPTICIPIDTPREVANRSQVTPLSD